MGHQIKVQKVDRPTNRSYYINLPVPIAEALNLAKGEVFEWHIEDKNTLVLQRVTPHEPRAFKHKNHGEP